MLRIPQELEGARLNVSETAELVSMETGHFRRLVRRGIFPSPKRTQSGLPFFDHELLLVIADVVKRRVGVNGKEVMMYRRKPRTPETRQRRQRRRSEQRQSAAADSYVESILEGCRQVGVPEESLSPDAVLAALTDEFGNERPGLEQAIPVVARRLLAS